MKTTTRRILVLGGARSGKSRFAEGLAEPFPHRIYLATATALDDEMRERIHQHRVQRSDGWRTIEEPMEIGRIIEAPRPHDHVVLVDCLTLWLSNLLLAGEDLEAATAALAHKVAQYEGNLILVSNEVGLGLVPENALARRFRDAAGRLNQAVAADCSDIYLICAGIPVRIK